MLKVKEDSEKVGLKLGIQKTNIMASGPITSWQIDGETVANFWRRKWQPTPVFLPGESCGQRNLADYSPPVQRESDMTEVT